MDTATTQATEVDLHRLELRFAAARLIEPRAIEALAHSIEQSGQLIACIAVPDTDGKRLILIDGYRRVQALHRLGRDTARVVTWNCELPQALLTVLAQSSRRPFAAMEEALLLQELVRGQGLSEREVARRSGRDVSWVSRRLELVCGLPDSVIAAVRQGTVSLGRRPGCWPRWRAPTPRRRANCSLPWRLPRCPPASSTPGSSITRPARVPPASAWLPSHVCSSRACAPRKSNGPTPVSRKVRKASSRPMSGNCLH